MPSTLCGAWAFKGLGFLVWDSDCMVPAVGSAQAGNLTGGCKTPDYMIKAPSVEDPYTLQCTEE